MKINKQDLIKIINENLDKIFSTSSILNKIKNDEFANLIIKQISILDKLEKSAKVEDKKANLWLKKLNEINASNHKLIKISINNNDELYDDVNYIRVYIKNVFKIDMDNPQEEIVKAETININDNNFQKRNEQPGFDANSFDFMNSMMAGMNPETMKDLWYKQMAKAKILEEVKTGKFYQFKTKPKIVPILKTTIMTLLSLMILLFLVKIIMGIVIGEFKVGADDNQKINFFNSSYSLIEPLIIFISIYVLYSLIVQTKNENTKFFFVWKNSIFIGIVWAIYLGMSIFTTVSIIHSNQSFWEAEPKAQLILTCIYISYTIYALMGLMVIVAVIVSLYNPKFDKERYEQKLDMLYNEIKNDSTKKPL